MHTRGGDAVTTRSGAHRQLFLTYRIARVLHILHCIYILHCTCYAYVISEMFLFLFFMCGGALAFLGGAEAPVSPSLAPPMPKDARKKIVVALTALNNFNVLNSKKIKN